MAFVKVGGNVGGRRYVKYAECTEGDVLAEGTFIGSEEGRYGVNHLFDEGTDTLCVLNSAGQLNHQVDKHLTPGVVCRVTYLGRIVLERGPMAGKESHQFSMEVDYDATANESSDPAPLEVAPAQIPAAQAQVIPRTTKKVPAKAAAKAAATKAQPKFVSVSDDIEL